MTSSNTRLTAHRESEMNATTTVTCPPGRTTSGIDVAGTIVAARDQCGTRGARARMIGKTCTPMHKYVHVDVPYRYGYLGEARTGAVLE